MEFVFNGKTYNTDKPVYVLLFKHMDNSWQDCHGNRHGASVGFFLFGKSEIAGKDLSFTPVIREGIISRMDFSQKDGTNSVERFFYSIPETDGYQEKYCKQRLMLIPLYRMRGKRSTNPAIE